MTILVLSPHADDAELAMGGTIAKWCHRRKQEVVIAVACASKYENRDGLVVSPEDRELDQMAACHVLGAHWHWRPFDAENKLDLVPRSEVADWIDGLLLQHAPSAVYVCLPWFNQDHTALWDALQVVARRAEGPDLWAYEMPGQHPPQEFGWRYEALIEPDIERKGAALMLHATQRLDLATGLISIKGAEVHTRMRGMQVNRTHAERFLLLRATQA